MSRTETGVTMTSGIGGLLPFARPAAGRFALAAALAVGSTLLELVPYYAIYRVVDQVVEGGSSQADLTGFALLAAAGIIGRFVLFGASLWVSHLAAYEVLYHLRVRMAERLARVPLGWFSRRRSGEVKKVMADDVERLELFLGHAIPDAVSGIAAWVFATAWLLAVDWRMAVATAAVVPVALLCMRRAMSGSSALMGEYQAAMMRMNGAVTEFLRGLPVIKMFNRTGDSFTEAQASVDEYVRVVGVWYRRFLPLGTAYFVLLTANVIVLVPVGLSLYLNDAIDVSSLLFFFLLGIGYSAPLSRLLYLFSSLSHMATGGNLVSEILSTPEIADSREPVALDGTAVEFRGVGFGYEQTQVLFDVSFIARAGEVTALVGPSGSGKTTIARLIPRFWDVDDGAVLLGGVDVRHLGLQQLMDSVAFVFQDTFLFDDTVEANLRMGRPEATDAEVEAAARAARAHHFVAALPDGYATRLGAQGARLSGGERQRLALARAILKDAPIIVLDEATAFADPENEAAIQDAIGELVAGKTVVMIAHRLSTVAGASQILVVDKGRIVERGTHAELLATDGLYGRLWEDYTSAEGVALGSAVRVEATRP